MHVALRERDFDSVLAERLVDQLFGARYETVALFHKYVLFECDVHAAFAEIVEGHGDAALRVDDVAAVLVFGHQCLGCFHQDLA